MNILAFAAHPDDIDSLCGGTLLKYRKQGHNIFIALATSCYPGANKPARREEAAAIGEAEQLEAAKQYDAQVRFLRLDTGGLQDTPETRRAVLTAIRWANPDIILTSPPWDPSTDHGMIGRLITQVLLIIGGNLHPADLPPIDKSPQVFFWDIPAGLGFLPEVFVDISEEMPAKLDAIRAHKSRNIPTEAEEGLLTCTQALSEYRGFQSSCKCAEAFVCHKMYAFMANPRMLP